MNWTEYLRIEKRKDFNKSEDDIYLDYYNQYLCNEDFENEILDEIEYEAKLDNLEDDKARDKRKYHKQYYLENKRKLLEYQKEYSKEYYLKNKEYFKEYHKQYYLENKEKNREKRREYHKQYRLKNKEKITKYLQNLTKLSKLYNP